MSGAWLRTSDRDRARAMVAGALPSVCTILRKASERDEFGGLSSQWEETPGVPCRIGPMSNTSVDIEVDAGGHVTAPTVWKVTLPAGTDITMTDRISVDGHLLEVANSAGPRDWEVSRVVTCVEVLP